MRVSKLTSKPNPWLQLGLGLTWQSMLPSGTKYEKNFKWNIKNENVKKTAKGEIQFEKTWDKNIRKNNSKFMVRSVSFYLENRQQGELEAEIRTCSDQMRPALQLQSLDQLVKVLPGENVSGVVGPEQPAVNGVEDEPEKKCRQDWLSWANIGRCCPGSFQYKRRRNQFFFPKWRLPVNSVLSCI